MVESDVYTVFDLETTGLEPEKGHEIIEMGAVRIRDNRVKEDESFVSLVKPERRVNREAREIHGISQEMVEGAPALDLVLPRFLDFIGETPLVAQNAPFDLKFMQAALRKANLPLLSNLVYDTKWISKMLFPEEKRHNLDSICERLHVNKEGIRRHRSLGDVILTAHAFIKLKRLVPTG